MRFSPRQWALAGGALVVIVALVWFRHHLNLPALHARAEEFPVAGVISALILLPLVGVPVSVLHAVTGAKFGLLPGLALVGMSIALQLLASYGIVQLAPKFFARRFGWLRRRLPPATHRSLTLFTMLLPGAPYFAQNYVLAIARVPFAIYFGYSFPIHFLRSVVGVIFGEWSENPTPLRVATFIVYAVGITVLCGWAFRRLRSRLHSPRRAEGGRKRSG